MQDFVLANLNERTDVIKDIKKYLVSYTRQDVIAINTSERLKKVAGEVTKNVLFYLSGGQQLQFLFRKNGDIVKVKINSREYPTAGHLMYEEKEIFRTALKEIAQTISKTQRNFELRKAKSDKKAGQVGGMPHKDGTDAGKSPKTVISKPKRIEILEEMNTALDDEIAQKQSTLEHLTQQYAQMGGTP